MSRRTNGSLTLVWLFLAAMAAGCDGILGIEGFEAGCNEGEWHCSAETGKPQSCNAIGQWIDADACAKGSVCSAGACVPECVPGRARCDALEAQFCNASGAWEMLETCGYECKDGACRCEPKTEQCRNNRPEICAGNGSWQPKGAECIDQTCVVESSLTKCIGACAPGKRCLGNTPQICNVTGQWEGSMPCESNQVCVAGNCNCLIGDLRCSQNTRQVCNENHQWADLEAPCSHQTCDPDNVACVGVCEPGETNCNGTTPQSCGPKGQWQDEMPCALACVGGACTECIPGESDCDGNSPRTCGMDSKWQVGTACVGQTCVMGVCQGECAPGIRCLGNTPELCNDAGQWEGIMPCDSGQVCIAGTCNCVTGDLRCFQNTPQLCNASNQWVDDGPACSGQTCDPDMAACVGVCEPAQKQCLDAMTAQLCDAKGQWQTVATCVLGCIAGECASCTLGQVRCTGNTPQTCGVNGQWQDEPICVGQTCLGGSCLGECEPGSLRCAGKWSLVCDLLGGWQPLPQSCALGESCFQGQCEASCMPGTKRCAGDYPQACDNNGAWQSDGAPCGACIECNPDTGMCDPNPMPLAVCTEPVAIATGSDHTCALFPSGKIKCCGYNFYGQIGLGDQNARGDGPGEMGANLPFVDLGLAPAVTVAEISMGGTHTGARTSDGRVKCWGDNGSGQLALGDTNARGDGAGEMGDSLPIVEF